jgi:hypothetical protein
MSALMRILVSLSFHKTMRMDHLKTMEITITPTSTIGDLKRAITAQNHVIWPEYQRIYTTSFLRPFPEAATLEDCGIREGAEVKMDYALKFDETGPR